GARGGLGHLVGVSALDDAGDQLRPAVSAVHCSHDAATSTFLCLYLTNSPSNRMFRTGYADARARMPNPSANPVAWLSAMLIAILRGTVTGPVVTAPPSHAMLTYFSSLRRVRMKSRM